MLLPTDRRKRWWVLHTRSNRDSSPFSLKCIFASGITCNYHTYVLSIEMFPSFSNLIIYLYFFFVPLSTSLADRREPLFLCTFCIFDPLPWNLKFLFSEDFFILFCISCSCYRRPSKTARETCIAATYLNIFCRLSLPLLKYCIGDGTKKCTERCMYIYVCIYPYVYLWCELDVQCRVIGAQGFAFFVSTGAEKSAKGWVRGQSGIWVCILYFPIFIMPKRTYRTEHASSGEKRIIFRVVQRRGFGCAGAFSVIFIIDWPVFHVCDATKV